MAFCVGGKSEQSSAPKARDQEARRLQGAAPPWTAFQTPGTVKREWPRLIRTRHEDRDGIEPGQHWRKKRIHGRTVTTCHNKRRASQDDAEILVVKSKRISWPVGPLKDETVRLALTSSNPVGTDVRKLSCPSPAKLQSTKPQKSQHEPESPPVTVLKPAIKTPMFTELVGLKLLLSGNSPGTTSTALLLKVRARAGPASKASTTAQYVDRTDMNLAPTHKQTC